MRAHLSILSLLALGSVTVAAPAGKLSLVQANASIHSSPLCETTPGVTERRGYFTIPSHSAQEADMHIWFWYFSPRNPSPTAPLVTWLNGGPGASSMIGLFQNNGPCHFTNSTTLVSNPYSFNTDAHMLYIDQPAGTGFSYGSGDAEAQVNSTTLAVKYVYEFLQAFLQHEEFRDLARRKLGIASASYGGHYGPELVRYIQEQNAAAAVKIDIAGLAVNDGLFDYGIQYPTMAQYMFERGLIEQQLHDDVIAGFERECKPALDKCDRTGTDEDCAAADDACYTTVERPLTRAIEYPYDIRGKAYMPPNYYTQWFGAVGEKLGNETAYVSSSDAIFNRFVGTGDTARSFVPQLDRVVSSGIPTLVWVGDQDMLCNYIGVRLVAESIQYGGRIAFKSQPSREWSPGGGASYGLFKAQDNLSYLQVYNAGHNLQFGQPQAGLEAFNQFFFKGTLSTA